MSGHDTAAELAERRCVPCEGGVEPLTRPQAEALLAALHRDWALDDDAKSIVRAFRFRDFFRTMSFVNAIAHIANTEDHHPDLEVGYDRCKVRYRTHSIRGLSVNDFICAAKIDRL
jgi:4a-hydroxytetrahydrobiopterin dehydratase